MPVSKLHKDFNHLFTKKQKDEQKPLMPKEHKSIKTLWGQKISITESPKNHMPVSSPSHNEEQPVKPSIYDRLKVRGHQALLHIQSPKGKNKTIQNLFAMFIEAKQSNKEDLVQKLSTLLRNKKESLREDQYELVSAAYNYFDKKKSTKADDSQKANKKKTHPPTKPINIGKQEDRQHQLAKVLQTGLKKETKQSSNPENIKTTVQSRESNKAPKRRSILSRLSRHSSTKKSGTNNLKDILREFDNVENLSPEEQKDLRERHWNAIIKILEEKLSTPSDKKKYSKLEKHLSEKLKKAPAEKIKEIIDELSKDLSDSLKEKKNIDSIHLAKLLFENKESFEDKTPHIALFNAIQSLQQKHLGSDEVILRS